MAVLTTIRWHARHPGEVDERLSVGDDGAARLDVLVPRLADDRVGVYAAVLDPADAAALTAAGALVSLDVTAPDPATAILSVVADRVAAQLRDGPLAVARFHVLALGPSPDGGLELALVVTGQGTQAVEFVLDVAGSAVGYRNGPAGGGAEELLWSPLPALPTGFMTTDAEGLGGVGRPASVLPDVLGAISMAVARPPGAVAVLARLVGTAYLPPLGEPAPFAVSTGLAPLPTA